MHILIVEDEKDLAGLLKHGLEEENHRVALAYDGRDALKPAAEHDFDAIVLDVMLPGIDGFEVARRLRRAKNETPVLMLTARDAAQDVVKGWTWARTTISPSRSPSRCCWRGCAFWCVAASSGERSCGV